MNEGLILVHIFQHFQHNNATTIQEIIRIREISPPNTLFSALDQSADGGISKVKQGVRAELGWVTAQTSSL